MKTFRLSKTVAALGFCFLACNAALAQIGSPVGPGLVRVFDGIRAFTARADIQVLNAARKETQRTPMNFALLDGKLRVEVNVADTKSAAVTPAAIATYKQMGLDQIHCIIRPDQRLVHFVFPRIRSYVDVPMLATDVEITGKDARIQKAAAGKENAVGRVCGKNRFTVRSSKGAVLLDATTWTAPDLKDFPVQILVPDKENMTILRFQQVQLATPAATLFDPPAGFTRFASVDALLNAVQTPKATLSNKPAAPPPSASARKPAPQKH